MLDSTSSRSGMATSQRGMRPTSQRGTRATAKPAPPSAPESYASPQVIATYLTTMRQRAALLSRTGQRGSVYVSVPPRLRGSSTWDRLWTALSRDIRPAEARTFTDLWGTGPGHIERYLTGWEDYADTLTGLVVMIGRTGAVGRGRGIVREIESARLRGLPILVGTATSDARYVPLIDCRTTSYLKPWPTMQIDLPTAVPGRATLVACLAAMGATEGVRQ